MVANPMFSRTVLPATSNLPEQYLGLRQSAAIQSQTNMVVDYETIYSNNPNAKGPIPILNLFSDEGPFSSGITTMWGLSEGWVQQWQTVPIEQNGKEGLLEKYNWLKTTPDTAAPQVANNRLTFLGSSNFTSAVMLGKGVHDNPELSFRKIASITDIGSTKNTINIQDTEQTSYYGLKGTENTVTITHAGGESTAVLGGDKNVYNVTFTKDSFMYLLEGDNNRYNLDLSGIVRSSAASGGDRVEKESAIIGQMGMLLQQLGDDDDIGNTDSAEQKQDISDLMLLKNAEITLNLGDSSGNDLFALTQFGATATTNNKATITKAHAEDKVIFDTDTEFSFDTKTGVITALDKSTGDTVTFADGLNLKYQVRLDNSKDGGGEGEEAEPDTKTLAQLRTENNWVKTATIATNTASSTTTNNTATETNRDRLKDLLPILLFMMNSGGGGFGNGFGMGGGMGMGVGGMNPMMLMMVVLALQDD